MTGWDAQSAENRGLGQVVITLLHVNPIFRTWITENAPFDSLGVKIKRLYFLTFLKYTTRPF